MFCCQRPTSPFVRPPSSIPVHRSACLKTASASHTTSSLSVRKFVRSQQPYVPVATTAAETSHAHHSSSVKSSTSVYELLIRQYVLTRRDLIVQALR